MTDLVATSVANQSSPKQIIYSSAAPNNKAVLYEPKSCIVIAPLSRKVAWSFTWD